MVAFVVSTLLLLAGAGLVVVYAKRRPVGTPPTWGEAMLAAVGVFALMLLAYGIVPHQWLTWADNELGWRRDRIFEGWGGFLTGLPFTIPYEVIRDIVAVVIYGIGLGGQIALWALWQGRGERKPRELPSSAYGRPLVKKA